MDKKYSVKQYVYDYLESNDKSTFLHDRVICTYVPFETKLAICEKIVENTFFSNERYSRSSSSANVLFRLNLIALYTDVDVKFGDKFLEEYNILEEYDALDCLVDCISQKDISRFYDIFENVKKDVYENNCSNVAIYTALKELFATAIDGLSEYTSSVDFQELLHQQKG